MMGTGRFFATLAALLAVSAVFLPSASSQTVSGYEFANWTDVTNNVATGTLRGSSISLSGDHISAVPSSRVDGSSTVFDSPVFTPPLAQSDAIEFQGADPAYDYVLQFGSPVANPVLHISSLASKLDFPVGTDITKVSGEGSLNVASNSVIGSVDGSNDASGTVRLNGSFSSIAFSATIVYTGSPDGIALQVGTKLPDPPPPPPGAPQPENVSTPTIREAAGGSYACDPGEWRNLPSPPGFRFLWRKFVPFSSPELIARTQSYTPKPSDYGYQFSCQVTVPGPNGYAVAHSPRVVFSSAGLDKLPPAYGDVRIRGIDMAQVVQGNARTKMYDTYTGFGTQWCGGGTPTVFFEPYGGGCRTGNRDPQSVAYPGVPLDRYKRTVALVYVDVADAEAADPNLEYDLELSATSGGRSLGSPVVKRVKNPPRSGTPWVNLFERDTTVGPTAGDGNRHAIPVLVPSAWRSGTVEMTARLRFPDAYSYGTAQYGMRQCDGGSCLANDAFTLREVPFASFPDLRLATLELRRVTAGQAPLRSAGEILTRAKWLFPGGLFIDVPPYRETLDITDETRRSASQYDDGSWTCGGVDYPAGTTRAAADRSCRWDAVAATMRDWISRNPARRKASGGIFGSNTVIRDYDVAMGAHNYGGEPGASQGNILSVGRSEPMETNLVPLMTADATTRPLTAAAHELGHVLTAPHAGRDCPTPMGTPGNLTGTGKDQEGEIWRGDDRGLLQGTKFIQRLTGAAAEVQGAFSSPTEGTFSGGNLFDLMSYCAPATDTFASDGNAWISAYNWNRFTRELGNLARRLGGSARSARVRASSSRVRARSSASRTRTYAVGVAGARSGRIMRVRSDRQAVVPGSVAGSPLRLRSLDAAGRVLLDAGVAVKGSTHSPGTGTFLGPVASGAAAVELVHGSAVVNKVTRTKPPKVSVLSPGRRTRVRGKGRFTIRWRASDPDSRALRATVDYSPDGRNWRSVFEGPSTGRARIPGRYLAASKRARIRVTLSDGFAQASATSRRFRALGTRPRVRVLSPEGGAFLQTGERITLIGSATDDFGIPIRGRRLTWYAGRKRLGRGARLRRRLPAGTRRLRLVARDRTGRKGVASLAVRVRRPRLRIARLVVPAKVRRKATTMTVRIRTSAPARLTVGRRRYRIGRRTTKVTIRLPRRPKVGIVGVRFKLSPRGGKATGTTRGRFSTVRT